MKGEAFVARLERLGIPITDFNGANYRHWSRLLGGRHDHYSDAHFDWVCREIAAGRSGRDRARPLDDAARGRIVATIQRIRTAGDGFFCGEMLVSIGEGILGGEAQP